MSPQVNESLSQLYLYTQSFKLHMDWLKTAKQNVSLSSQSAQDASTQLLQLFNLLSASLRQVRTRVWFGGDPEIIRKFEDLETKEILTCKEYCHKKAVWYSFQRAKLFAGLHKKYNQFSMWS